jgi:peroxiredoxin
MKCISCSPCLFSKFAIVLALVAGYFAGCSLTGDTPPTTSDTPARASRGTALGQTAPDFELARTDGGAISNKDLAGGPSVLVFWTAWCPACKEEAPHVNSLASEFGPKGVKVVGINIGESDARIAEGIKDFGIQYIVAKDRDTSVSKAFKVAGTPTVVILDRNGVVRYFGNEVPTDYRERLETLVEG